MVERFRIDEQRLSSNHDKEGKKFSLFNLTARSYTEQNNSRLKITDINPQPIILCLELLFALKKGD